MSKNSCELCHSEWGNYFVNHNENRLFFCCKVCWEEYKAVIEAIKFHTGWSKIDKIDFSETHNGRTGIAFLEGMEFHFNVIFTPEGEIWSFKPIK